MEARPAGLTTRRLVAATGLSPYQVRKGTLWIKEVAAREHLTPLVYTTKGDYRFPADSADWVAYEKAQFAAALTRISRLLLDHPMYGAGRASAEADVYSGISVTGSRPYEHLRHDA